MTPELSHSDTVHHDGWLWPPNVRGTGDILWSCFFAVFVCTWTILHLNLPGEDDGYWTRALRKIRWMTFAVIIPEVVTASAFAQRVAAKQTVRLMQEDKIEWTMAQAFYYTMGGVRLCLKDGNSYPINAAQLRATVKAKIVSRPEITKREVWDRSKADKFAKLFACLQIFWLAIQCIGRAIRDLPITPLEVATLGFAVPSLATFAFWYHKPVDIEVPNKISCNLTREELLNRMAKNDLSWIDSPLDVVDKLNTPSVTSELIIKNRWWPGRDRFLGPADRIRNDGFALKYTKLDQVVVFLVWVAYAGTHFTPWTFSFPTRTELLWWRISCIVMSSSMFVFWVTSNRKFYLLVPILMPWVKDKEKYRKVAYEQKRVSGIQVATGVFTTLAYLVARLSLIALAFSSLRSLPEGAYVTVEWLSFLPHVS